MYLLIYALFKDDVNNSAYIGRTSYYGLME
jgi:hypothetical protein